MGDFDRNGRSSRGRSGGFRGRDSGRDGFGRGRSDRSGGRDRGGDRERYGGRDRDRDRRSERHEMHSVICDKCGKDCEVPFKPTQGKPIYCSDCFKDKSREAGSRSGFGGLSEKPIDNANLDKINEKLNRILKILEEHVKGKPELKKPKKQDKKIEEEKPKKTELPVLEKPKKIEEQPKLEYAKNIEKPKKKKPKKKK